MSESLPVKELTELITRCLQEGSSIEIDGLGNFELQGNEVVFRPSNRIRVFLGIRRRRPSFGSEDLLRSADGWVRTVDGLGEAAAWPELAPCHPKGNRDGRFRFGQLFSSFGRQARLFSIRASLRARCLRQGPARRNFPRACSF